MSEYMPFLGCFIQSEDLTCQQQMLSFISSLLVQTSPQAQPFSCGGMFLGIVFMPCLLQNSMDPTGQYELQSWKDSILSAYAISSGLFLKLVQQSWLANSWNWKSNCGTLVGRINFINILYFLQLIRNAAENNLCLMRQLSYHIQHTCIFIYRSLHNNIQDLISCLY